MSTISTDLYHNQALKPIRRARIVRELRTELIRKSIHLLIAFVPSMATIFGTIPTVAVLALGILSYTGAEYLRFKGRRVPIISRLTELASRERDKHHFVLGPVTLGIGAMLALMLYPNPAAAIAVYALAFGDGLASLVGKAVGKIRLPFTGGKSLEGSLGCFLAVFLPSYIILGHAGQALLIAGFATLVEALPTRDFDNIVLPSFVGAFVMLIV